MSGLGEPLYIKSNCTSMDQIESQRAAHGRMFAGISEAERAVRASCALSFMKFFECEIL